MTKSLYFDIAASLIYLVLLICTLAGHRNYDRKEKTYILTVVVSLITACFDIACVYFDNTHFAVLGWRIFATTGYLFFHALTSAAYFLFLLGQSDNIFKLKRNKIHTGLICLPMVILTILLLLSPFTNWMFYFDEEYAYHRGPLFLAMYVTAIFYIGISVVNLFRYRTLFPKKRFYSFVSLVPVSLTAIGIQFFFPNMIVEMFATAISFIFISTMAQRPEERIDMDTELNNEGAFVSDMHFNFRNKKPVKVILLRIVNYPALVEILPFSHLQMLALHLADDVRNEADIMRLPVEFYNLRDGHFAMILEGFTDEQACEYADCVRYAANENTLVGDEEINVESNVCLIRIPEDIKAFDDLLRFERHFFKQQYLTETVLRVEQDEVRKDFDIQIHIDSILHEALEDNLLEVRYQPVHDMQIGSHKSLEAKIQLKEERFGTIDHDTIVQAAERNGMIYQIGEIALNQICQLISTGYLRRNQIDFVSFNLSSMQCCYKNMAVKILDLLQIYNLDGHELRIEVSHPERLINQGCFKDNMNILRAAGVGIVYDEFGDGEFNIDSLQLIQTDMIKLSPVVIRRLQNEKSAKMIQGFIRTFHDLGQIVVATGVDDEETKERVEELGCDYYQDEKMISIRPVSN